tara:strand:- start:986 stop:1261 length:276 start_codon:yes stop_codon:yes gene_type:complete
MKIDDIQNFLDEYINPALKSHNGFLKIIKYDENNQHLYVELGGGCQGCSASKQTLQVQVKSFLLEEFPDIKDIIDTTDHSAGKSPYYQGAE